MMDPVTILGGLGLIGKLFSSGAGESAKGRRTDSQIQAQVDQLKAMQAANQFTAGLQGARYGVDEQVRGIRQPQILRYMNFGPQAVARYGLGEGENLEDTALGELLTQRLMAPGPRLDPYRPVQINDPRRPGRWENVAGGVGSVLQMLGGVGSLMGGGSSPKESLGMKSPTVLKQLAPLPRMGGIEVDPFTGQPLY